MAPNVTFSIQKVEIQNVKPFYHLIFEYWIENADFDFLVALPGVPMTQEQSTTAFGLKKWTKMDPKRLFFTSKSWNSKCDAILSSNNWISNRKCVFCILRGSFRGANDPRAVATALGAGFWANLGSSKVNICQKKIFF